MLTEINAGMEADKTIYVLKPAHFCIEAWKYEVTPQTCANCFWKSGVFGPTFGPLPRLKKCQSALTNNFELDDRDTATNIYDIVGQLQSAEPIQEAMATSSKA
jgi:hypothetical protein